MVEDKRADVCSLVACWLSSADVGVDGGDAVEPVLCTMLPPMKAEM